MKMKQRYKIEVEGFSSIHEFETDFDVEEFGRFVAEDAAEDYHSNHDGWEDRWPLKIILLTSSGEKIFNVEREFEPVFYATEINDE